ncbi:MAG: FtsW/RodA/SpoVE family cell cycle protein [candidate division WOR-3 bacterium]|nr:FtsW/RodA/SpoVE family cell cycle protein [candidate division WOR-3 bacterium]
MKRERWIMMITAALIMIGLIMLFSASSFIAYQNSLFNNNPYFFLKRQFFHMIIGIFAFFTAKSLPLTFLKRIGLPLVIISLILLVLVLIIGERTNGAKRWLDIGIISFQPSVVAEFSLILFISSFASSFRGFSIRKKWAYLALAFTPVPLILFEPNISTAVIMAGFIIIILFISGIEKKFYISPLAVMGLTLFVMIPKYSYAVSRISSFMGSNPDHTQTEASLLAFGSGGFFGEGIGLGRLKLLFIPEAYSDFIFSIIGEELGLIGALLVLGAFIFLLYQGLMVAKNTYSPFGKILAFSISLFIFLKALLHMAISVKLLPTTGIGLPFISYGGTSLIINMALIGILIRIAQNEKKYV